MDELIKRFDSSTEKFLSYCRHRGVAYQTDMRKTRVDYGDAYSNKVEAYAGNEVAQKVNKARLAMIERHLPKAERFLDYGAGSGDFMEYASSEGWDVYGYEVLPKTRKKLIEKKRFSPTSAGFKGVCLWDVIEHIEMPSLVLRPIEKGAFLFVSLPIFPTLDHIDGSKHYRPGEHLYYWTREGFIEWMAAYGFRLLETSDHEVEAGRESIGAFAFVKDLPDYHDHVAAYMEMHSTRFYGASATELYLDLVLQIVKEFKPKSILDFGCGRSDMVAHFWRDGERRIARYDPAIPLYKVIPEGEFDLLLCLDVMEHIPISGVDRVLTDMRAKSDTAVFAISTKLARAKLPDGRNSHVTLLTNNEWINWISDYWGGVKLLPSRWDHELIIVAGNSLGINGTWARKP
jgi:2-polyprenyl-3-methyl-5-hydroxy-6-metoxy-1,4-benzoquinol methylase